MATLCGHALALSLLFLGFTLCLFAGLALLVGLFVLVVVGVVIALVVLALAATCPALCLLFSLALALELFFDGSVDGVGLLTGGH